MVENIKIVVDFIKVFHIMEKCITCCRIVIEHWQTTNKKTSLRTQLGHSHLLPTHRSLTASMASGVFWARILVWQDTSSLTLENAAFTLLWKSIQPNMLPERYGIVVRSMLDIGMV